MPQTLANGIIVPTNPDSFASLAQIFATMGNSANVIIPVANQAARDALTKANGLAVARLDLPGTPIELCDGTNWLRGGGSVSTYTLPAPDSGWSTAKGGLIQVNIGSAVTVVMIDLYLLRSSSAGAFTLGTSLGSMWTSYIPAGWRPSTYADLSTCTVDNTSPAPVGSAVLRVGTDGTVQGMVGFGQSALTVNASYAFHIKGSWTL